MGTQILFCADSGFGCATENAKIPKINEQIMQPIWVLDLRWASCPLRLCLALSQVLLSPAAIPSENSSPLP